jgi:hypothetical protein
MNDDQEYITATIMQPDSDPAEIDLTPMNRRERYAKANPKSRL